ncbi:MAG: FAD-binding oxidoreductase [Proteobacteria bacterium]|nr:FAD-binding oxidoreductase [Pseudomonadota bacterium]
MSLDRALTQWRELLGRERVLDQAAAMSSYGADCGAARRRIAAALRIGDALQVPDAVRIALAHGVAFSPVSTGRNWGYGTALPAADDCVLLDLSELRRIVHFDAEMGVVTVEPGVTQGALSEFLSAGSHPFMVPTTGAGPDCSLVGNALERGFGITPHADHFAAVTDIEAVLADGTVYRTALREMAGDELARLFKWGIGPYSAGLFTQGSLGVVTRMSIVLARRPATVQVALFGLEHDGLLEPAVTAVRKVLSTLPGLVGGVNLMNRHRVLAMTAPYPRDRLGPDGLISEAALVALGRQLQIAPWTGFATLYGTPRTVAAARKEVKAALAGVATRLVFVSPRLAQTIDVVAALLPGDLGRRIRRATRTLRQSLDIASGRPSQAALPLAYWLEQEDKPVPAQPHPSRDGVGLIWYAPLVPMRAEKVREFVRLTHEVTRRFGIEPLITLTSLNDRLFECTIPILFERHLPHRIDAARACLDTLIESGRRCGVFPYRLGIESMHYFGRNAGAARQLHARMLSGLDGAALLNPGRYS